MASHSQRTSPRSAQQESTKHHLKAPIVLASSHPIKGQARVLQGEDERENEETQETTGKTPDRDRYLKQSPLSSFSFL
jgi:hypothetical protein